MSPLRLATRSVVTGTLTSVTTSGVAAVLSKLAGHSAAAPLNAASQPVHGAKAVRREKPSLKYTLIGFGLNYAASILWGAVYERMRHGKAPSLGAALARGSATAATAFLIDQYVVPRFTGEQGMSRKLDDRQLLATYVAMALSLPIRELIDRGWDEL